MKKSFERWALERLKAKPRCKVEKSFLCIPLRADPICGACRKADEDEGEGGEDRGMSSLPEEDA